MKSKLHIFLENGEKHFFLIIILTFFVFSRIPSLIEPYWYGDEGIYQVIGKAMNHGRLLYRDIWDNKPPVLYLIYQLFNGDQFSVRMFSMIFGAGAVISFYFFARKLFDKTALYVSSLIFAILFGLPILEGNIANSENFMLFPIILAFSMLLPDIKRSSRSYVFSGLLISLAFLIKIVAFFDFLALLIILIILKLFEKESIRSTITYLINKIKTKKLIPTFFDEITLTVSFLTPILLTGLFFFINGAFSDFYTATFSQNIGYVGWGNKFIVPMGALFIKEILLTAVLILVYIFRRKLTRNGVIIIIWLAFSIFNAFFSQRAYGHYLLVLVPSFSLFVGYIFSNKKILTYNLLILIVIFLMANSIFKFIGNINSYKKQLNYYNNYFSFILGKKSISDYQLFFDDTTPRDYDLANFIRLNTKINDDVFLWTDSAQIYALSDKLPPSRYIVSYHITFYKDALEITKNAIESKKPKYIISTKDSPELSLFVSSYKLRYSMKNAKIYERKI